MEIREQPSLTDATHEARIDPDVWDPDIWSFSVDPRERDRLIDEELASEAWTRAGGTRLEAGIAVVPVALDVEHVLALLNDYNGEPNDNIWEDVIYGLPYDEAATDLVEHGEQNDVVIGGVHFRYEASAREWGVA